MLLLTLTDLPLSNLPRVNGRSLYITDQRILVVDEGNIIDHVLHLERDWTVYLLCSVKLFVVFILLPFGE